MQEGGVPYRRLGSVGLTLPTQVSNVEKYSQRLKTLKKKYPQNSTLITYEMDS